jgi:hypothetical protein
MEPQYIRSQHDVVTLRNIDTDDFTFEFDRSRGNYPYTIKAGELGRFPRFLAEHCMKKLIDKILNKQKIKTNNEAARAAVRAEIFVEEEVFQQETPDSPAVRLHKEVESLNKPSDLEKVLSKNKSKEPVKPAEPEVTPENKDEFEGLEDEKAAKKAGFVGATVDTTVDTPKQPEVKAKPTREELYTYAAKIGMVLDEKDKSGFTTRQKLDKLKIDDLIKELQYE